MKIFIALLCALVAASVAYELTHYCSLRLGENGKPFCGGYMIVEYYMASRASCIFKDIGGKVTSAIPEMYAYANLKNSAALSKVIQGYYPHAYIHGGAVSLHDFAILKLVKPLKGTFVSISVDMSIEPSISYGQILTMLIWTPRNSVTSIEVEYVNMKDCNIASSSGNNPPEQHSWIRMSLNNYLSSTVSDSDAVKDIKSGKPLPGFFSGNPILLSNRLIGLASDQHERDGDNIYIRYTDVGSYGRVIIRNNGGIKLDGGVQESWARAV